MSAAPVCSTPRFSWWGSQGRLATLLGVEDQSEAEELARSFHVQDQPLGFVFEASNSPEGWGYSTS